jgi:hypothetical protein
MELKSVIAGVKSKVVGVKATLDNRAEQHKKDKVVAEKRKVQAELAVIKKRKKYLPIIQRLALKYNANVEALDTAAYVYKQEKNRQIGVHINYGEPEHTIERKLETKFTKSARSSRIIKGVIEGAHTVKQLREDIGKAGTAVKGAMGDGKGGMYDDPNFGGAFATRTSSAGTRKSSGTGAKKKKKSAPRAEKNSLFPEYKGLY